MALVLVVDDQASNRDLVVTLLRYAGHQSLEAADGHMALALAREKVPDLVICDLLMPAMDGYEFVRQLRLEPTIAATKIIFYTATFMEQEASTLADACGVTHVLVKPCEPEEILRVVADALSSRQTATPALDMEDFDREHLRVLTNKLALKVEELEHTNHRMSALTDLSLQLASERDPYELLNKVCRGARELTGARRSVLAARYKNGTTTTHLATWGLTQDETTQLRAQLDLGAGLPGQVMEDGRSRRFSFEDGQTPLPPGFPAWQHGLLAPIVSLHHSYGWILLLDKLGDGPFSAQDLDLLAIHAAQAGRIYENGSLYKRVQHTAEQLALEIVERKAAAAELRVANETLELRVQERTAQLHEIIDGLESFTRSVSHDLRGPLGGIAGAARLARDFVAQQRHDKVDHFLEVIADQAEQSGRMVESLLHLARASDIALARQDIDATQVVQAALALLQAPGAALLPVQIEALPQIDADPDLAQQVFVNLIGNALKFTAGAGSMAAAATVVIGALKHTGAPVLFVRDQGVGFDASQAERLFKPFHRLHGAQFAGSGVGLSIVKRILDRHGGRVWAESSPGQGATFYVSFGPQAVAAGAGALPAGD
ncbi:MAG TPA: ATP-binding protein [Ideonella sp.]|uniref:ATP-binding protein n=1 Tax=Ideonella sp. TaxID=1929293 RepID=UPI002BDB1095|nr:ATP-binding protein [Ideonella sp.]HSI50008.1 ATP-binding protein [Ideonella sp.]